MLRLPHSCGYVLTGIGLRRLDLELGLYRTRVEDSSADYGSRCVVARSLLLSLYVLRHLSCDRKRNDPRNEALACLIDFLLLRIDQRKQE